STQALFWHLTNGSEPASYTWDGGAGGHVFYEGAIVCYSGVNPTTPLDPGAPTGSAATGTGTSITAPALTLQTAGDLVLGYFQDSETSIAEGATFNLPASLTSSYTFTDSSASYEAAASGSMTQISVGTTPALTATTTGGSAGDSLTGAQIALQPENMLAAGVSYPAGSTKRNASGAAYYSQIDATPVMGTTGACGSSCAW